ncbi:MAG: ABC transporter permease subunit [Bacillota bacterium]|nr:ABC transporter permease subunit [Bacillota bacterium]
MSQWLTLFQKELLEMWRNFKWIWVPITFILLGVQEPLSSHFMPQIINSLGGLPDGAVIKIPPPSAQEVLIKGLSQYTSIGVLIIVLTTMGLLSGERKSGVAAMILVKPVSYESYVTSKWVGAMLLMWGSFLIGYLATWYYTGILFKWVPISDFFASYFYYGLWLTLALTVTISLSAMFLTSGMAGFLSLAIVILMNVVTSSLSNWMEWSPAQITTYANKLLLTGKIPDSLFPSSLLALVCTIIFLLVGIFVFKRKELASS